MGPSVSTGAVLNFSVNYGIIKTGTGTLFLNPGTAEINRTFQAIDGTTTGGTTQP